MMNHTNVNNVPAYADEYRYLVATDVDGEFWFYGAWDDLTEAERVAQEVNGLVMFN